MKHCLRFIGAMCAAFALLTSASAARAFCGFYVSGADAAMYNDATQVVLMREGTRTILSMQNQYKGPPQDFAMVVPVPVVLQKENVKTLPRDVFERVDALGAPRLVEFWEQDPCPAPSDSLGLVGTGQGFGNGTGRLGAHSPGGGDFDVVKIEAKFEVGEYEIVILSALDSTGLDTWLRQNGYKIPANAEPLLRPYVEEGSKFFVAKVNIAKARTIADPSGASSGVRRAELSPLRFSYETDKFSLPVRLGLLNSQGTQDLIVNVLAPNQRYVVANYPNVTIPTNIEVTDATRASFPSFYASLFDKAVEQNPGAVVTEYAWGATSCDPCPTQAQGLSQKDLATLGADTLPSARFGPVGRQSPAKITPGKLDVQGRLPPEVVTRIVRMNIGRFRFCHENALRDDPSAHGTLKVKFVIGRDGSVQSSTIGDGSDVHNASLASCVVRAFGNLSFPQPEGGIVIVTAPFTFESGVPANAPIGLVSIANFDITRLHLRYAKDALANDLVFKTAPPIVGGREVFSRAGTLEHGAATDAGYNNFQARYVIRHPWKGPIACKEPQRGVWGGPPAGVHGSSAMLAATKLGNVKHGALALASFLGPNVGEQDIAAGNAFADRVATPVTAPSASASVAPVPVAIPEPDPDAGPPLGDASVAPQPPPNPPSSRCGCRVGEHASGAPAIVTALVTAVASALRRRRRGPASSRAR
jgi:MYXO-CTERM domain-containing protein